jgi:hypothetical protein
MQRSGYICIPLRRQSGEIAAYALIDHEDAEQATHRWHLSKQGYAARRVIRNGHRQIALLHREILGLMYGDRRQGDHISGDRLDYRRLNLRIVTKAQNAQNKKLYGGSSRHRGVAWNGQASKWMTYADLNGKRTYLGLYESEDEAAAIVRAWRLANMTHTNEARNALV